MSQALVDESHQHHNNVQAGQESGGIGLFN